MRPRSQLIAVLGISVLAMLAGACRKDKGTGKPDQPRLLLYCGAGIRPPVTELAEIYTCEKGVQVDIDFAGSEMLLSKLKLSRRGDLYMPGDRHYTDQAAAEGLVLSRAAVCYFVPTILVRKGNPKRIAGLRDLLRDDVKLGLGDDKACAVGRTTRRIFEQLGIPWAEVGKSTEFSSLTVNELGLQVQAGSLDAAIVWDAIARYYPDACEEVPIPLEQNTVSTVDVASLSFSQHRDLAEQFVQFAASERCRAIFARHHYRVDPPASQPAEGPR